MRLRRASLAAAVLIAAIALGARGGAKVILDGTPGAPRVPAVQTGGIPLSHSGASPVSIHIVSLILPPERAFFPWGVAPWAVGPWAARPWGAGVWPAGPWAAAHWRRFGAFAPFEPRFSLWRRPCVRFARMSAPYNLFQPVLIRSSVRSWRAC